MRLITRDTNVEAIVRRAAGEFIVARHCERCGDRHDPETKPEGGARYFVGETWLCAACNASGPVAT